MIEFALSEFATMDSNNFPSNVGVGEREGRVYSSLVARRNFRFSHGIGRSGDIAEVQPKAAGSSLMYKLTMELVLHALQLSGSSLKSCLVLPLATGMTLTTCMLTLRRQASAQAEFVIWPRIDQKSCFKSILTAGLTPLIVENEICADGSMQTNVTAIRELMVRYGERVLCVLSTTSCFAPRQPDLVDEIAKLCKEHNIGHVINNAYGVQCTYITKLINRAAVVGRVDAVVQSTDKNFMVPVGGAIVSSSHVKFITDLSAIYPGRASAAPIMDLFITLLSMGENGYKSLLLERIRVLHILTEGLQSFASSFGERIMLAPRNSISIGVTLTSLDAKFAAAATAATAAATTLTSVAASSEQEAAAKGGGGGGGEEEEEEVVGHLNESEVVLVVPSTREKRETSSSTFFGAMLFQRCVSGCRVVPLSTKATNISGYEFLAWGAHTSAQTASYFTAACAIGLSEAELHIFFQRLTKTFSKLLSS